MVRRVGQLGSYSNDGGGYEHPTKWTLTVAVSALNGASLVRVWSEHLY